MIGQQASPPNRVGGLVGGGAGCVEGLWVVGQLPSCPNGAGVGTRGGWLASPTRDWYDGGPIGGGAGWGRGCRLMGWWGLIKCGASRGSWLVGPTPRSDRFTGRSRRHSDQSFWAFWHPGCWTFIYIDV